MPAARNMFWPLLLAAPLAAARAVEPTHGVPPALLGRFAAPASGDGWACLDGRARIPYAAVNDDYCDCPDGSDEPGTGACANTTFFCRNEGHIGASIPSSRVNDGLCETACCDGSDEAPGVCPNQCAAIGETHRAAAAAAAKLRKTGGKIRSSYIAFAQKEKKRLEALLVVQAADVAAKEEEVARLRDIADRTESVSAAAMEHKKASPLYASLQAHALALKSLRAAHTRSLEREEQLGAILDALRTSYNPNYQDMGVLEAVRGWEALAGLPHINDVRKGDAAAVKAEEDAEVVPDAAGAGEGTDGLWSAEELEQRMDETLAADYDGLLIEHDKHVGAPLADSLLFDAAAYLPAALVPQFDAFRGTLLSWFRTFGLAAGGASDADSEAANRARQNLNAAEATLRDAEKERADTDAAIAGLADPAKFGPAGEWKKLDGTCLEHNAGEYTYEVCLFGEARQKPNKGGQTFSLGHFAGWNTAAEAGTEAYYSRQDYKNGAQCWNGPQRSVVLRLVCGTENELHSVQELEKCEYEITGTSPALCMPLPASSDAQVKREEL